MNQQLTVFILFSILVGCTAVPDAEISTAVPTRTPIATTEVAVTRLVVTAGPTATPVVCTAVPSEMIIQIIPVAAQSFELEITGLTPGEILHTIMTRQATDGQMTIEQIYGGRPVDSNGHFTSRESVPEPLPDGSNEWQMQIIHARGVACLESSLPPQTTIQLIGATPTPLPTPTAIPPTSTSPPTATAVPTPTPHLITSEPIFTGGDIQVEGWSPDGRYLAYFEYTEEQVAQSPVPGLRGTVPGTFTFYDTVTGEKCQRYPLDSTFPYEGPGIGQRHFWLPNGALLVILPDGRILQTDVPCGIETELTPRFPDRITNIVSLSPDQTRLLLTGSTAYWLYNWQTQTAYPLAEIAPDSFNNLVWSPEGSYIGVTLAGNYTGDRSPIGGTRVVDVATGEIVTRYDWEPANALDGTFGGPVWLNENEMVITLSLDQGPFFLTLAGEARPLLPLFGLEFKRGQSMPQANVYVDPVTGHYHILLTDLGGANPVRPQIYHSDAGVVEIPNTTGWNSVSLWPNGRLVTDVSNNRYHTRHITAVNEPFTQWQKCTPPWSAEGPIIVRVPEHNRFIDIYTLPDCALHTRLQLAEYADGHYYLQAGISPDGRWLLIIPADNYSRGQALFLINLADVN